MDYLFEAAAEGEHVDLEAPLLEASLPPAQESLPLLRVDLADVAARLHLSTADLVDGLNSEQSQRIEATKMEAAEEDDGHTLYHGSVRSAALVMALIPEEASTHDTELLTACLTKSVTATPAASAANSRRSSFHAPRHDDRSGPTSQSSHEPPECVTTVGFAVPCEHTRRHRAPIGGAGGLPPFPRHPPGEPGVKTSLMSSFLKDILDNSETEPEALQRNPSGLMASHDDAGALPAHATASLINAGGMGVSFVAVPIGGGGGTRGSEGGGGAGWNSHGASTSFGSPQSWTGSEEDEHETEELNAYLIGVPIPGAGRSSAHQSLAGSLARGGGYMLAVPDAAPRVEAEEPHGFHLPELPQAQASVRITTKGDLDDPTVQAVVTRTVPWVGFLLLAAAVVCISLMGAMFALEPEVGAFLKCVWRCAATCVCVLPWLIADMVQPCNAGSRRAQLLLPFSSWRMALLFTLNAIGGTAFIGFFAVALTLTTVANAFLLGNCHSMMLVCCRLIAGMDVSRAEGVGALIGLSGAALSGALDSAAPAAASDASAPPFWMSPLLDRFGAVPVGNCLALLGSAGGVIYLVTSKRIRPLVSLPVFTMYLYLLSAPLFLAAAYLWDHNPPDFSSPFDPDDGVLGWATRDRLWVNAVVALVCTIGGSVGYVAVMKYVNPLVVSVAMLSEPIVGSLESWAGGLAGFPSWGAWLGSGVTMLGTLVVVADSKRREKEYDITQAVEAVAAASREGSKRVVQRLREDVASVSAAGSARSWRAAAPQL